MTRGWFVFLLGKKPDRLSEIWFSVRAESVRRFLTSD